jgi:hypothetical protein
MRSFLSPLVSPPKPEPHTTRKKFYLTCKEERIGIRESSKSELAVGSSGSKTPEPVDDQNGTKGLAGDGRQRTVF